MTEYLFSQNITEYFRCRTLTEQREKADSNYKEKCENKLFVCLKSVFFWKEASAEGHCQESMKQIAEHAYFICLSGLVWRGEE